MSESGKPEPWIAAEGDPQAKKHAPATERNRDPILTVLRDVLPATGRVLEIASGSGEHAIHFARAFPNLVWQPSDPDPACRASIAAWAAEAKLPNLEPPVDLDAAGSDWAVERADAVQCINMVHISPWSATLGLLSGAARLLPSGAPLYFYGPFCEADRAFAPSNAEFDRSLRARNPDWGIRDIDAVRSAAEECGLAFERAVSMPANNLSVVFRRTDSR